MDNPNVNHQSPERVISNELNSRYALILPFVIYLIPVAIASILFGMVINRYYETTRDDAAYFFLIWLGVVAIPLIVTIGVFVVYRNTYRLRFTDKNRDIINNENEWQAVISKALEWKRFALPFTFFNLFVTVVPMFLLSADISASFYRDDIDGLFGVAFIPLNAVDIPTTIFYFGYLGFMIHFLEMTRRRYVSRNLVPHFYMTSAFQFLYVTILIPVFFVAFTGTLDATSAFFADEPTPTVSTDTAETGTVDAENADSAILAQYVPPDIRNLLVLSFVIGMFPLQSLSPIVERIRERLGLATYKEISIRMIHGIDNTIESLLQEENIDSVQILAMTDVHEIHQRTAIPEKVIIEWQKQAKLYHILSDEELIHRFARIGINDFDDLEILATRAHRQELDPTLFFDSFKKSMQVKDPKEAINQEAFWEVLIQVLVREFEANQSIAEKTDYQPKEAMTSQIILE